MADRAKKVSELTSLTAASGDDLLLIVDDPSGTPATKSITVNALFAGNAIANGAFANLNVSDTATIATAEITTSNTNVGTFANLNVSDTATIATAEITISNTNLGTFADVIATNTASLQTVKVTGSILQIDNTTAVTSNSATAVFGSGSLHDGKMFWDENYLYIATSNTTIKRIALSVWNS
jgi:hypothetical protein